MNVLCIRLLITANLILITLSATADSTFIKFGSSWKYLDNGTDQGTDWRDSSSSLNVSWPSGQAEFGYGNNDERTLINYGGNAARKYITTYFRKVFSIHNKERFSFFTIKAYVNDGMVVYVNGKEVCRTNMHAGDTRYNTLAAREAPENGNVIVPFNIPSANFVNGNNTIAVEVHQGSSNRSDLTFDLQLMGISSDIATEITKGPMLQMVSEHGVTIKWKTNVATSSLVYYGNAENSLDSVLKDEQLSKDHEMRINGLKPDTKYYYAVGKGSDILEGSYLNYFITAPSATSKRKIRIGVFGDAGTGNTLQSRGRDNYLRLLKKGNDAELALFLGDNAYNTGSDNEFQSYFFNIYNDNILNNHVVFPIPGNHDYYTPGVPYFSQFALPTKGESGGLPSGTESYYSFDYGNIHFVMLNSMGRDNNTFLSDSTGKQAEWLKKDLEANAGKHKWTIACLHHPPYTNGTHNSDREPDLVAIRQQLTPILEKYGVDAVLAGHSHVYERSFLVQGHTGYSGSFKATSPATGGNLVSSSSGRYDGTTNSCPYFTIDTVEKKGTIYVVAGSAGTIGGGTNSDLPVFYYKNYSGTTGGESGVLYLEVEDNRLDAKFIGVSGTVRDQFTIMKGVNTKKVISVDINKPVELTASWVGSYNWSPKPPGGNSSQRSLTIKPASPDTYTYFVKDSIGPSKTCISDTFVIKATSSEPTTLKFDARQKYNSVLLKWSTNGSNVDYFTVERSSNGQDFTMLTMIKATVGTTAGVASFMGVSTEKSTTYEFEDNYPRQEKNYYRLKTTTRNGQTAVLGQRMVDFNAVKSFTYTMLANTAGKNIIKINIESAKRQLLQIRMFDMTGKLMYHNDLAALQGDNRVEIVSKPGIYVLNIVSPDNTRVSEKIVLR